MNLQLTYYKSVLLSMGRGRKNMRPSNAKPLYLLTLISLYEDGSIIGNKLAFDNLLNIRYSEICKIFEPDINITPVYKPFYHMSSEDFYYLKWKNNSAPKNASKTPSAKYLRENVEYAALDDDLWQLLQNEEARNEIKDAIINFFLKSNE